MLINDPRLLVAAKVYAETGFWVDAARVLPDFSKDFVRRTLCKRASTDPRFYDLIRKGRVAAKRNNPRSGLLVLPSHGSYDPLPRHREIHALRTAQPSPSTIGQYLMGEPLPGRSALDKINTDQRCDSTKTDPRFIRRVFGSDNGRRNVVTLPNIQLSQTV